MDPRLIFTCAVAVSTFQGLDAAASASDEGILAPVSVSTSESGGEFLSMNSHLCREDEFNLPSASASDGVLASTKDVAVKIAFQTLDSLREWDLKPDEKRVSLKTILFVKEWLSMQFQSALSSLRVPRITASHFGEVVLEWWNGARKLTFYVEGEKIEFLRSWGVTDEEMMDGIISSRDEVVGHLDWIR